MSDRYEEIRCYECGRLKTRLIWKSRCVTCTVQRLEANLEENDSLRGQLAALEEENERLKARIAELEEVLTELCDEIDKHEIHTAISKTSISWFKRKARTALDAYRKEATND